MSIPRYDFRCRAHGTFELVRKMRDASLPARCPECNLVAERVYHAAPAIWHTEGSHNGDYGKGNDGVTGDKREILNKNWSKAWGEPPPPPAADVPRNGAEKY